MMTTESPAGVTATSGRGTNVSMYRYNNTAPAKGQGNSIDLIKTAMDYLKGRMSVIPVHPNTKKPILSEWGSFIKSPMSLEAAQKTSWPGLGIITGKVSGNLECLDFDYKANLFDPWAEIVEIEAPGLVERLLQQNTQNSGKHIVYRCSDAEIPGNKKLAAGKIAVDGPGEHEFEGKIHKAFNEDGNWYIAPCFVESRGEGGYFLAAPTPGYEILNGSFSDILEITLQERNILLRAAKAVDLNVKPFHEPNYKVNGADRPGDIYNAKGDVRSLLSKHGWKMAGSKGDFEHYTRPGKDKGVSASLINGRVFNVFTSNAYPLEDNKAYSPFSLYAAFEHNGDYEAAARELRELGFGNNHNQGSLSHQIFHKVPEPLPLPDELLPVMAFDYELLPESLQPWAKDISERMQCPPDFVAVSIMAAMAAVIGRKVGIRPQERTDWTVVCNIWALVVGRPGVLKSPALEAGLAPLNRLIASANDRYQGDLKIFEIEEKTVKLRQEAVEKQAKALLAKNPKADLLTVLAAPQMPVSPILKRYKANDTSPASLGELLRLNPNGLLVFRDEIVSLLKGLDRDGQDEGRGFYLTAWNGDSPYTFDRIGRGLNLHIPAICLSLLGGTQPGKLSEYIRAAVKCGTADDGLIQRFGLMVWPDLNGEWLNIDRHPDIDAKNRAFQIFDALDRLNPVEIGAQQDTDYNRQPEGIPYLRFEPAALELFLEWRLDLEKKLRSDLHPALESHFAKYRKLIPSIALIIHLSDGGTGPVSETATLQALAWSEYLESHARRVYGSVSQPGVSTAKAILNRLKKGDLKSPFSSRDVWRPGWSHLSDRDQVKAGLQMLEDYNHLDVERIETSGRAKTLYHYKEVA